MPAHWYAMAVGIGLTETPDYALRPTWKQVFDGISRSGADAAQCEMILASMVAEPPIKNSAEERCGNLDKLLSQLDQATTEQARVEAVASVCHIDAVAAPSAFTAYAVLAAALLEDELAAQAESTKQERDFARHIRSLCTMPPE